MPASLQLAQPASILPHSLNTAWSESYTWPVVANDPYSDGRVQARVDGTRPRRAWTLTKKLTHVQWVELRDFFTARKGSLEPFYFYPRAQDFDVTGQSFLGRVTVRFDGRLSSEYGLNKFVVSLSILEVA